MPSLTFLRYFASTSLPPIIRSTSIFTSTKSLPRIFATSSSGQEVVQLVAPAAPGCAEVEEDALVLAGGAGHRGFEDLRRHLLLGCPLREERADLLRVVVVALFERVGQLLRQDLAVGVEHGEERVAHLLDVALALLQQRLGVRRLGVDHHELVVFEQRLADRQVRLEQGVQLVAPAAPVAAEHHEEPLIVAAGDRAGRLDLLAGVELGVVDRRPSPVPRPVFASWEWASVAGRTRIANATNRAYRLMAIPPRG